MLHIWFDLVVFVFVQPECMKALISQIVFPLSAFHKRLSSKNDNEENHHEEFVIFYRHKRIQPPTTHH